MIINIESVDKMIEQLCDIFDITAEFLEETILDFANECKEGIVYDEGKFIELAEEFITSNLKIHINEIYVCHLTRHIGEPQELLPLKELLTGKNKFTCFLKRHGVTFGKKNNYISMSYMGTKIDIKDLYDKNSCENEHVRLAGRLGCCGEADYCVNGYTFAINPENSMKDYYMHLQRGPELLQDLDNFFSTKMCEKYREESKYYLSIFKVSLDDVIFDGMDSFNVSDGKEIKYLVLCFMFLLDYYDNFNELSFNQIVRLDDYQSVKVDHNILIE